MRKFCNITMIVCFAALLFVFPVQTFLQPAEEVSAYENRTLAPLPELSLATLLDGSFAAGAERYLTDHIAGRNLILELYVRLNRDILQKPVVNDVYESEEGSLLARLDYDHFNEEETTAAIEHKLSELAALDDLVSSYGGKLIFCGVPEQRRDRYDQYPSYLMPGTETIDLAEQLLFSGLQEQGITAINMYDVFTSLGGQDAFFSQVDHHYTFDGARVTYETIMDTINSLRSEPLTVLRGDDLILHEEEVTYFGSYNRKIFDLQRVKERLSWGEPIAPIPFTRMDNGYEVAPTVYTPMDGYASYGSFMNGDIAETVISTARGELPDVLVFGDSFTNPVETLLYYSFDEMRSLDLRYYTQMTLFEYVETHKPDYVVIIRDRMQYAKTAGNGTYR